MLASADEPRLPSKRGGFWIFDVGLARRATFFSPSHQNNRAPGGRAPHERFRGAGAPARPAKKLRLSRDEALPCPLAVIARTPSAASRSLPRAGAQRPRGGSNPGFDTNSPSFVEESVSSRAQVWPGVVIPANAGIQGEGGGEMSVQSSHPRERGDPGHAPREPVTGFPREPAPDPDPGRERRLGSAGGAARSESGSSRTDGKSVWVRSDSHRRSCPAVPSREDEGRFLCIPGIFCLSAN